MLLDAWVPALVATLVERIDLTRLVEENVDLDRIVSTVDLDAAVARVDLDAAVARVDLDAPCSWTSTPWSRGLDVVSTTGRRAASSTSPWWRFDRPDRPGRGGGQARRGCRGGAGDFDAVIDRIDLDAVAARLDVDAVVARATSTP